MEIQITEAAFSDKPVLRNLMELYIYDFSAMTGADVNDHGMFGYSYLDNYWTEPDRFPFLIRVDGKLAGFVLVRDIPCPDELPAHTIAEFFIMQKYRRMGIGAWVARNIFDRFPGRWRVAEVEDNSVGQVFWRKVIAGYTQGHFEEILDPMWNGPIQSFVSPAIA